jgi:hypothetical protein
MMKRETGLLYERKLVSDYALKQCNRDNVVGIETDIKAGWSWLRIGAGEGQWCVLQGVQSGSEAYPAPIRMVQ